MRNKLIRIRLGFAAAEIHPRMWPGRFYDFNVWSHKKKREKLQYMHFNPVKRGLVGDPRDWPWSSYSFYSGHGDELLSVDTL
jgi:putative transposase